MASSNKGRRIRDRDFSFDAAYTPLNHGSYGTFPSAVRDYQRRLQDAVEARSDPFIRFEIPKLLDQSRAAAATLLGASPDEVVIVPNATTAINTVLRNIQYQRGDVLLYCSTTYPACRKTIESLCETTPAESRCVDITFPLEDEELVKIFRQTVADVTRNGSKAKLALFDTIVTFPGVRMPWEQLVKACRELGVLSLVDGAHGIGHIDLTGLGTEDGIKPDFFTSNCYKWLYTPRPCAVFYVLARNQHIIRTTLPTSHGFQPSEDSDGVDGLTSLENGRTRFVNLFQWAATIDQTAYLCIPEAIRFRESVYGGEEEIRRYCFILARDGGKLVAEALGTETMTNAMASINQCCFTNIRLPLDFTTSKSGNPATSHQLHADDGPDIVKWIMEHSLSDHNTWIPGKFYAKQAWVRLSAQVYLEEADFVFAAGVLGKLCDAVKTGAWRS